MNGTEKQVAWAEDIKSEMLAKIDAYLAEYEAVTDEVALIMGFAAKEKDAGHERYVSLKNTIEGKIDAEWFIKYKNTPVCVLAERFGA